MLKSTHHIPIMVDIIIHMDVAVHIAKKEIDGTMNIHHLSGTMQQEYQNGITHHIHI